MEEGSATSDLVLAYFDRKGGAAILDALARTTLPRVHVGTYGIDRRFAAAVAELPNAVYAPMFPIVRSAFWERRSLTAEEAARLPPSRWSGALPPLSTLLAEPALTRVAWGTELGRRFRDALRHAPQPAWQFDEIVSQVATGRAWRDVVRGVLDGIALGRPRLGDRPQKGFVWMARRAFPLTAAEPKFWSSVERAAGRLVGEEYPEFTGDPRAVARALDANRRSLPASLRGRYVAGLSPGVELRTGLGGNVRGLSRPALRRWRSAYAAQRLTDGVRGTAYFDFRGRNAEEIEAILR